MIAFDKEAMAESGGDGGVNLEHLDRAMAEKYERHRSRLVDVPPGSAAGATVERFIVERGIGQLRTVFEGRALPPGEYSRLRIAGASAWMTDTPAEYRDAVPFIHCARGSVLISGLGLGMVVKAVLKKSDVEHLTVIEVHPGVIALVGPAYQDPRLRIIEADCRTWKPDRKFDWAWHDIWGDLSTDDLPEMATLCRHYARAMTAPGRQMVWGRDLVRRNR